MNHAQFLALQKLPGVELRINRSAATELVARGAVSARAKMYERISANAVMLGVVATVPLLIWSEWWIAFFCLIAVFCLARLSINWALKAVAHKLDNDSAFFDATKGTGLFLFKVDVEWMEPLNVETTRLGAATIAAPTPRVGAC